MPQLNLPHLDLEYEVFEPSTEQQGDVLLLHGLGTQMTQWPMPIIEQLVAAGHRVIRFDNRDIGLSRLKQRPKPKPNSAFDLLRWRLGARLVSAYGLQDMARDALALLDHLNCQQAHLVGVSMGGMIAQELALIAPQRVRSLNLIMTTTGARGVGGAKLSVIRAMTSPPADKAPASVVQHLVRQWRMLQGPAYPASDSDLEQTAQACLERGLSGTGFIRQLQATLNADNREPGLRELKLPTLVVHGTKDPLVNVSGGKALARVIPDARLELIDGWGHDLPPTIHARLSELLLGHLRTL
ncbi:MAG: alpha/beta fold hydrolase [Spongiibacteraceae bacterium]